MMLDSEIDMLLLETRDAASKWYELATELRSWIEDCSDSNCVALKQGNVTYYNALAIYAATAYEMTSHIWSRLDHCTLGATENRNCATCQVESYTEYPCSGQQTLVQVTESVPDAMDYYASEVEDTEVMDSYITVTNLIDEIKVVRDGLYALKDTDAFPEADTVVNAGFWDEMYQMDLLISSAQVTSWIYGLVTYPTSKDEERFQSVVTEDIDAEDPDCLYTGTDLEYMCTKGPTPRTYDDSRPVVTFTCAKEHDWSQVQGSCNDIEMENGDGARVVDVCDDRVIGKAGPYLPIDPSGCTVFVYKYPMMMDYPGGYSCNEYCTDQGLTCKHMWTTDRLGAMNCLNGVDQGPKSCDTVFMDRLFQVCACSQPILDPVEFNLPETEPVYVAPSDYCTPDEPRKCKISINLPFDIMEIYALLEITDESCFASYITYQWDGKEYTNTFEICMDTEELLQYIWDTVKSFFSEYIEEFFIGLMTNLGSWIEDGIMYLAEEFVALVTAELRP